MRSADILKMLKWDTLRDRRQYHTAVMMFKILFTDALELYLIELFSRIRHGTVTTLETPVIIWLSRNLILMT